MRKSILLSNGNIKKMTLDETISNYNLLCKKLAHEQFDYYRKAPAYVYMSFEDYEQEVLICLCQAFDNYNIELGYAFSTFLSSTVDLRFKNMSRYMKAKKRGIYNSLCYLNESGLEDEDKEYINATGKEDENLNNIGLKEVIDGLVNSMDQEEKLIFSNNLLKKYSVNRLSEKIGITRQSINYRLREVYRPKWAKYISKNFNYDLREISWIINGGKNEQGLCM